MTQRAGDDLFFQAFFVMLKPPLKISRSATVKYQATSVVSPQCSSDIDVFAINLFFFINYWLATFKLILIMVNNAFIVTLMFFILQQRNSFRKA